MVSSSLEEMESISYRTHTVCMLTMIKLSMSLMSGITVLWNGNWVRRVAKWLLVEME
jgi:hypothetical protein